MREEVGVETRCALKLTHCWGSADCPLPILCPPEEGEEAEGDGEEAVGEEESGPSQTLIRLFRMSKLS